ncbi:MULTISPECIES: filamentous hemagglutinin N-terminal domain-containing protein [unclassified Pseudomonas]|uniref:two-partner secretion domain-containing protein n=1 Tax=unclassified Pseudomonas TaxID=196821 RepID=UPI0035C154BC
MDVRLFAFLARQPSAHLQPRTQFCGMPKRGLAFLLANVMFWQPLWAQAADGVVVSAPGTGLGQAGNGVPIVNIAAPNGSGLSHNKFSDYNVGQQGLILNNATDRTVQTQLGGIILGNQNLQGVAASTILNEVNGSNPSHLRGYTEVAGQAARVIVANSHGITCDGCGFINTPQVTLSTGKPVIQNGQLTHLQVEQGSVAIEGAGLNANNVDRFEIITRSAKVNAEIHARNLTIIAGRNDVDASTLAATPRAGAGNDTPTLAIDSSALGGMYAGAIRLVGTEAGVGVRLDGQLAASAGDLQLDANGQLRIGHASAAGDVQVKAASLDTHGRLHAGRDLSVEVTGTLDNQGGTLSAGQQVRLNADTLDNRNSRILAGGELSVTSRSSLDNRAGEIASQRRAVVAAGSLDNGAGQLYSEQALSVRLDQVLNNVDGLVSGNGLEVKAFTVNNLRGVLTSDAGLVLLSDAAIDNQQGEVSSAGATQVRAANLDNRQGSVTGSDAVDLTITQALDNRQGVLATGKALTLQAGSLDNSGQGKLLSDGTLQAKVDGLFDNQAQGLVSGKGAVDFEADELDNRGGRLTGKASLALRGERWDNRGGRIDALGDLHLTLDSLDNRDQGVVSGQAALTHSGRELLNRLGVFGALGHLNLQLEHLDNASGRLSTGGDLNAQVTRLEQLGGQFMAQGNLMLRGASLDNRQGGLVGAGQGLSLFVDDVDNRGGELSTSQALLLEGLRLQNSAGRVLAAGDLTLTVAQLINQNQGLVRGSGRLKLEGQALDNQGGRLAGAQGAQLLLGQGLDNRQGLITSEGDIDIAAERLDNRAGQLTGAGALTLTSQGELLNQAGVLTSDGTMTLRSASLDNREGEIGAQAALELVTGGLDNRDGGRLVSNDGLNIEAGQVRNGSGSRIASEGALYLGATGLDQQGGQLFSKTALTLDLAGGHLVNRGLINAPLLVLRNLAEVDNQQGEISSAQAFTLAASQLDNSQGRLISNQALTLRVVQVMTNLKGLVSAQGLDLSAASLDNREGLLSSRGPLSLDIAGRLDNRQGTLVGDTTSQLRAATLDNAQGTLSSKGDLSVKADELLNTGGSLIGLGQVRLLGTRLDNRQQGLVGSNGALALELEQVDNRGGEISGKAAVSLTGEQLDNSDAGLLLAGASLTLAVQQVLNRNQGRIEAQTRLTLDGLSLDNDGGRLTSQQGMTLTLAGEALNRLGLISAEGQLAISAQSLDNSGGHMSSAGVLQLNTRGVLLNTAGELLSDGDLTVTSASLDNTDQGVLASKGALNIATGAFDNSRQGSVSSNRTLDVRATQLTNREGGRLGSQGALTANVTGLDQQGGQLFSNDSLRLNLNQGLLDNRGGLINAPLLVLDNLASVDNRGGEISSAQAFTLAAERLDNGDGRVLSNQALLLRINQHLGNLKGLIAAQSLDARTATLSNDGGTLSSRSTLTLATDGLLSNRERGLIEARDALSLASLGLDNHGGTLLGSAIALDVKGADLDNGAGLISTAGPLTLANLRKLANQGGEISTAQALQVNASELENRAGKLISERVLEVDGGLLDNRGGLISGWQGLEVRAQSLDNREQGTLSSRAGALQATIVEALRNSGGGALVAQHSLSISAASLDNSAGGILSSSAGQQLDVAGTLANHDGGLIDAGAGLTLVAQALNNRAGSISAKQDLAVTATQLDNSDGRLVTQGGLTLDLLGELLNRQGKLASGQDLLLQRASRVDNQGGQIASQGLLTAVVASFDNSQRGTLAASGVLTLTSSGALLNSADGLIYSQQSDLSLRAASLDNRTGALQAEGALSLEIDADLDNQGGKVIAQNGALTVLAASLDNRGGTLSSLRQALSVTTTGVLRNDTGAAGQGGILQALRLHLQSASLDNRGGRIAALNGDALLRTGQLDNRAGGLSASGLLKVDAASLLNGGDARGEMVAQRIELALSGALDNRLGIIESASTLAVSAASLDNQSGQLRALGSAGKSQFAIGGLFDNRAGVIEVGNTDLELDVGLLQNAGGKVVHAGTGTFDIDMANLTRAGGSLLTRGGLTLTADSWTNGSVIQAGRLTLNINHLTQTAGGQLQAFDSLVGNGVNWSNDGLIASDGNLGLNLSGTYSGNGRVTSLGTLDVKAAQMSLGANAGMTGVGNSTVNVAGVLSNYGRLSAAGDLIVNAGTLNNYSTLGGNQLVRVTTSNLRNDHGLLFSGGDMQLYTGALSNFYGDVYSLGGLTVARDAAGSWAGSLENVSGSLESAGDMYLRAQTITNRKDVFDAPGGLVSSAIGLRQTGQTSGHLVLKEYYESKLKEDSPAGVITTGRDLLINGGDLVNSNSVITAQRNLTANLQNFSNQGSTLGTYTVLSSFALPAIRADSAASFWLAITQYNAANNRDYSLLLNHKGSMTGSLDVWDTQWNESTITASLPMGGSADRNAMFGYGWLRYSVYFYQLDFLSVAPSYNPDVRTALPSQIGTPSFFDQRVISGTGQAGSANAVVQAGGTVQINAAKHLTNSVIRQGLPVSGPSGKSFNPGLPSASNSAVITLHAQLPPDLARQQVNPLALGSFTLPTGQNGLFRLSGQGNSSANGSTQEWNLANASVATQIRDVVTPGTPSSALQATDASATALGNQQIERITHQGGPLTGDASAIGVYAPGGPVVDASMPQRHGGPEGSELAIPGITPIPSNAYLGKPHKYLIETNPALTDLKQFMSSDYLLGHLGYDPEQSWKRLGDGLYEQRLIQQAVVARTGQQFIDGQTSGEQLFKYLMDNAIRSKDALNLNLGVGLTAAQVAALTHDIVWMETHVVNGEEVLVPVLYLAHADNRLAPNGALIAGQDVTLIAGENLANAGTLKATQNLTVTAGQNLVNGGLIQAGGRLDLLAGDSLLNSAGGVIAGRDVSLTAILGDVVNQRDQTRHTMSYGGVSNQFDYLDSAARIEASNSLSIRAGQDVSNIGGVVKSAGDLKIDAGRDVNIVAVEQRESVDGAKLHGSTVQQHGAVVEAGRDVSIGAGRDITAVASSIDVGRDVAMSATGDIVLASDSDETHSYSRTKTVTRQEDHVRQVATSLNAGGDVSMMAGENLTMISSRISAGGEAYLYAGEQLELLAETDSDYSLYDKKSKGSFGSKKTKRDEVTDVRHVGSEITTGDDLILESGGNQRFQVAKLTSGNDLVIDSGGGITFEGVKDLHQESHEKSKSSAAWTSMSGKGRTDETLRQSELTAQGDLVINAVGKIRVDVTQVNQQTVRESIDAMVAADPKLAWLQDLEANGEIDWRQVQEIHTSFKYSNSSLGPAAQMIVAILMTVLLGPAGAGLGGWALAGASSLATTGTVATINNKGDLGAGIKAVTSKEGLTNAAIAAITANVAQNYLGDMTMTKVVNGNVVIDLGSIEAVSRFAGQQLINNTAAAAIAKAFGRDVKLSGILQSAIYNTLAAYSFDQVGNLGLKTGSPEKIALHALVGGMIAEASGSDFAVGAMAAGVNETFANQLRRMATNIDPERRDHLMLMSSQLLGVIAAAAVAGDDAGSLQAGSWVAGNATQYNNLNHSDMRDFVEDMKACGMDEACEQKQWVGGKYQQVSDEVSDWSKDAVSGAFAKSLLNQIQGGLTALKELNCQTPTCTQFKDMLTERALRDLTNLAKVTDQWEIATSVAALVIPASVAGGAGAELNSARVQAAVERFMEAKAVRGGANVGKNSNSSSAITDWETSVSGLPKTGSLKGEPEVPPPNASPDMVRSFQRQNESAEALAKAGFDVEQLPQVKGAASPDLRINGVAADVYAPTSSSAISVLKTVSYKVGKQADNIVVNLADSPLSVDAVISQLRATPVEGLKRLFLMKGDVKILIEGKL